MKKLLQTLGLAVLVSGCATNVDHLPLVPAQPVTPEIPDDNISVQYLGVGGFLMRYQDAAVLTGPSFTNPDFLGMPPAPFQTIEPDKERIDRLMPAAADASVMLVGHAHYDHLLDVPHVLNNQAPNARVYGSVTMQHTIASEVDLDRIVAVNGRAAVGNTAGDWLYDDQRRVRVMAIRSEHSPHFMGIKFLQGTYQQELQALPKNAFDWIEGQTFAWLIDFLDAEGRPVYRVHYQDAACNADKGIPPELNDGKRVDLSLQTVGAYQEVDDYPEGLVSEIQPRVSILGHWEDFFGNNPEGPHRGVRLADIDAYIERLEGALPEDGEWLIPEPLATMLLPVTDIQSD
ncbi:MBL fold metallo-hydrolase [Parendozoicomonas haliclonae]|uniref:Metal-dependent hydrolase n=1 Tax=Parendozoicomonas haliclonae TaxID=1960125 RepID=A0A1X7AL83_9GAMM|nr:MBL fold metallo-hydrolase [Parendozoicomonas haliclonae]SMA48676.1 hypothetical protein EHSB41UT_02843 [Parendozoicomonas haliclonae]